MSTDDEIKKELQKENPDRVWEFDEPALTNALNKARADTANQIFAELDPIIQTLDVNDQNCLKVIIAVQALKKKYKVY